MSGGWCVGLVYSPPSSGAISVAATRSAVDLQRQRKMQAHARYDRGSAMQPVELMRESSLQRGSLRHARSP